MKSALKAIVYSFVMSAAIGLVAQASPRVSVARRKPVHTRVEKQPAAVPIPVTAVIKPERKLLDTTAAALPDNRPRPAPNGPVELIMRRGASTRLDLRNLPQTPAKQRERPEREAPPLNPSAVEGQPAPPQPSAPVEPVRTAAAPPTIMNFEGLDFANWGAGHPPDTNGDVGPAYYIQTINTSIGIYRKSDGVRVAAFTFDTFMSQGNFGNLCDTDNFGDPVVLYDTFEDRWIITDFAFTLDGSDNVVNPPGSFQCIAASMSGDPVTGGWNFYSINTTGGLGDYPKFGIWPDGLYMSASMFDYSASGSYQNPRVFAFNKAQMYAGSPTVQVVSFDAPAVDFTLLPSNARLQAGTPPAGTPNYFVSTWRFLSALGVYKFHVDWSNTALSTFTGPDTPIATTSWPNASVPNAATPGISLEVLQIRAMMQNQYTNLGGVESLWDTHTVRRANTSGFAAPRWYQVNVTGGTVNANLPQGTTWDPDAANVTYRFVPSLALDRAGNMALGYSTSNSTTNPGIKYAGRLSTDPVNTFSQTEQVLIQGTGTQTGFTRWGDYAAMTLDPDGCTFWLTSEYYAANGPSFLTRIGSFRYNECTPLGAGGTISGTVIATSGGAPIAGATIQFGARSTTTNGSGAYSFTNIPAGTYPAIAATAPGYVASASSSIVVTDSSTTVRNFSLTTAPTSACLTDTSQADFQGGVSNGVDSTTSPGNVILFKPTGVDQQNTSLSNTGNLFSATSWAAQTFTAGVTGLLTKVDVNLYCGSCTGTFPNLTLSLRATSGGLPTGVDIATATIPGFNGDFGSAAYYTATFGAPPTLIAGALYALVVRPVSNPSAGSYVLPFSATNVYANGQRLSNFAANDSGVTWVAQTTDAGFKTYVDSGFGATGNLVSSLKDASPVAGQTPIWSALSWNGSTPTNTLLRFQVAGSSSASGPFNFIGPGGTGASFFTTSPASLTQFYGLRYLKYKAYLSTSDSAVTPALNDATFCYSNVVVVATAVSPTSVNVTWLPTLGATSYEILRRSPGGGFVVIGTTATLGFTDNTVSANTAYLYKVHGLDSGSMPLPDSAPDLATTVIFTDDPLVAGTTTVRAIHVDQLRVAANAVRALAGLPSASFTDASLTGVKVKKVHIDELRAALDAARASLTLSTLSYTDPTIIANTTKTKAAHLTELRNGVK